MSFTADKIAPVTFNLVVSTSYHSSNNLRNTHLLCESNEFKTIYKGKLSCHDAVFSVSGRKRDSVGGERSYVCLYAN